MMVIDGCFQMTVDTGQCCLIISYPLIGEVASEIHGTRNGEDSWHSRPVFTLLLPVVCFHVELRDTLGQISALCAFGGPYLGDMLHSKSVTVVHALHLFGLGRKMRQENSWTFSLSGLEA